MWNALSRFDSPSLVRTSRADLPANGAGGRNANEAPGKLEASSVPAVGQGPAANSAPAEGATGTTGCDSSATWDAFLQRRLDTAFRHGAALLPGFPVVQRESCATPDGDPPRRHVDVELWNTYWCAFADRFSAFIDDVQESLSVYNEEGARRRVLVAASLTSEPHMELFKDTLVAHSRSFGALEHVSRERSIVMLQFTSSRAANMFAAWAFSLTLRDLFDETNTVGQATTNGKLLVRLVSHDNSKVTSTLELGKNILLSTPFVESLFKGVFDAVSVTYHAGSFLVDFGSIHAAKIAVHSLQRSLLEVFGLTLTFSEQQVGCGGPSCVGEGGTGIKNTLSR